MKQLYKRRQYRRDRYPGLWPFTRSTVDVETALLYMVEPGQYLYSVTIFHRGQQYALNGLAELCRHPKCPPGLWNGTPLNDFIAHAQQMFWQRRTKPLSREVTEGVPLAVLVDKVKAAAKEGKRPKGFG